MILAALLILILSFIAEMFLPWWSTAIVASVIGLVKTSSGWKAFLTGFLGVGCLWWLASGFSHLNTGGILTAKIGAMLTLPSPILVVLITGFVGGLVGGLAAMAGFYLKGVIKK